MNTAVKIVFAVLLFGFAVYEVVIFVKQLKGRKERTKKDTVSPSENTPQSEDK